MLDKKVGTAGILETDGDFFANMRKMERRILKKHGDEEALKLLDDEQTRVDAENEVDDDDDD